MNKAKGVIMNQQEQKESARQWEIIQSLRTFFSEQAQIQHRPLTACVKTFGCQMNARDSEKLIGILIEMGFQIIEEEPADFVIYNTCTVRENANLKVYGRLGYLKKQKEKNPLMRIALCGCMMQEKEVVQKIQTSYPFVDFIFGTHNLYQFAELLQQSIQKQAKRPLISILEEPLTIVEQLPSKRKYEFKAGVNIMFGCNNFCSYCIVPYVRGRERSRKPEDILEEIQQLVSDGVKEIMLLGQNVNSYGKTLKDPISFAQLLQKIDAIDGLERIRFMTSHPKDLSDELIAVMQQSKHICRQLHLPVQSGSSEILKQMNRRYTREDYLSLIQRLKQAMPDLALSTDIIVGFPGETEQDFLETCSLVETVGYHSVYTFLYSKRSGTKAAKQKNQVPEQVACERFQRLLSIVQQTAAKKANEALNTVCPVLVEERNAKQPELVTGRLENNLLVHFPNPSDRCIGTIVPVRLTTCKGFYYFGEQQ